MFDQERFVDECRRALAEQSQQLAVCEDAFGVADGWRIDVLYNDDDLTIMHFVWPPSVDLFPHEHKMWSTVGIYGGSEDNTYVSLEDPVEAAMDQVNEQLVLGDYLRPRHHGMRLEDWPDVDRLQQR